ncbi:MAG: molecular chaperone GrpE (heat shock protein) [Parcubacteria group bacterium LiPW_72]|nr:MAG: molecular chaperone GrpE (heat shock protein) [Parcubacteria group bacterium LiPW_72]
MIHNSQFIIHKLTMKESKHKDRSDLFEPEGSSEPERPEGSSDLKDKIQQPKDTTKELEKCKKIAEENLAGWQRERADFENYRKRMEKRNLDLIKFANEELLLKILPILDHMEEALKHTPKGWEKTSWVEGVKHIKNHFQNILAAEGLREIELQAGDKFDPCTCEAVEKCEVEGKNKRGSREYKVVEIAQKGYELNGKLIRPARVKVE